MSTWLLVNTVLTLCTFIFLSANANAPHRLRFHAAFTALICWLIPWSTLPRLGTPGISALPFIPQSQTLQEPTIMSSPIPMWLPDLQLLFIGASGIGLALFLLALLQHRSLIRKLNSHATDGRWLWSRLPQSSAGQEKSELKQRRLYLQPVIPGAMTTGIFRPVIWISDSLTSNAELPAILLHEQMHVRQHDNLYLWLITFTEKLFWWNPFVRLLASSARRLQEFSCDEACARELPAYRHMLSRLILKITQERQLASMQFSAGMTAGTNFNVERIKLLTREYPMKSRHYLNTIALVCCAALPIGWVVAQTGDARTNENPALDAQTEAVQRQAAARAEAEQRQSTARAEAEARRDADANRALNAQAEAAQRQAAARAEAEARRDAELALGGPDEIRDPITGMTQTRILEGMQVYVANLEASFTKLQESNEALEQDLESLRAQLEELRSRSQ